jgi:hypothetical protein
MSSKTITYHGNDGPQVTVGETTFDAGEAVEVDGDIADRLLDEYPGKFTSGDTPSVGAKKEAWEAYRAAQGHDMSVERTKQDLIELPDAPAFNQEA